MKILVITNLFPNNKEPNRGVFNKQQMTELAKLCEVKVIAPVAWHRAKGILYEEKIEGLKVYHPRYFVIPKIGRSLYGFFFYFGIIGKIKKIYEIFKFDMILATWAYPDGFGAALVSHALKKPLVIKVHGSDVNIASQYFLRRKMITYTFRRAEKIIAVSRDLKEKIIKLGISERKIEVISNGIDTDLFKPMDKIECRKKLSLPLDKKIVLFVGNLEKVKGIDILVEAMKGLPEDIYLVVVGNGRLKGKLDRIASAYGLAMTFIDAKPHYEIPLWMNAADVFCLPSRNEGCPNVVLEALACGTPIAASRVGGIPEIIDSKEKGILVAAGAISELSDGINKALEKKWDKGILRQSVLNYDWTENARRVSEALAGIDLYVRPNKIKNIIKEYIALIIPKKYIIWHGNRHRGLNRVALTFDDGPNPAYTPKILDILDKYGVKATFFLVKVSEEEAEKVKISFEHEEFAWLTFSEAIEKMKIKSNKEMLRKAYEFIFKFEKQKTIFNSVS